MARTKSLETIERETKKKREEAHKALKAETDYILKLSSALGLSYGEYKLCLKTGLLYAHGKTYISDHNEVWIKERPGRN